MVTVREFITAICAKALAGPTFVSKIEPFATIPPAGGMITAASVVTPAEVVGTPFRVRLSKDVIVTCSA
jgi:hypothetical protein